MLKKIVVVLSLLVAFNANADTRWSAGDMDLSFTNIFFKTAFEDKKDNFVVSPLSVYVATVLLVNGADGRTRDELDKILTLRDWRGNEIDIDTTNRKISEYMKQKKDSIQITSTIIGNDFKQEYENKVQNELFVEIKHKLNDDKLTLRNEVDFNDEWKNHFEDDLTKIKDFNSLDGTIDKVDMMHDSRRIVDYYQDDKMQAVQLPYKNGDVMHIFLPREGIDFNEFVQNMTANDLFLKYHPVPVDISIPRFEIKYDNEDMISYYRKWGINKIFGENADLSKLSDVRHYVEMITHKADIKTTEKGTEAHAVTEIMLPPEGFMDSGLERKDWKMIFNANRPFIFMINNGDFIGAYIKGKRFEVERKSDSELDAE